MLSTIKEGRCSVESVLKGDVDQYVLDGTDRVLKIPRCLLERIEQLPHQVRVKMSLCSAAVGHVNSYCMLNSVSLTSVTGLSLFFSAKLRESV